MVLEGQSASYEIIQTLPEAGGNLHYRCRRLEPEGFFHLAGVPVGEEILSLVAQWQDNPAFADFKGYLIWEDRIYLVFPDLPESVLADRLESMGALQRFAAGQQMMEQFLVQDMPLCLQWELADPEAICLRDDESGVEFFYMREPAGAYGKITGKQVFERFFQFFETLFPEEIREEYPEVSEFFKSGNEQKSTELMELYVRYLELLPAFSRVPEKESEEEKEPFYKRVLTFLKGWSKKLLSVLKVALGVMTLCAALILLPEIWSEKIKPLVDGAVLWKNVYVDGETLPGQEESTAAPEETEENSDAQRETRYWENGAVRYQGGMLDDQYEGTGTLYYADGAVEYQGEFAFGKREGTGTVYTQTGQLLYEGQFHNDRYEGDGRLYDEEHGSLVYEGGFRSGKYSGEGTLYQPLSDFLVYVGGFRLGHYDGEGLEYDENGCMRYEGDFLLGVYHGNGTMYDPETGAVLFSGAFRNGMPVLTDELDENGELLPGQLDENGGPAGEPNENGEIPVEDGGDGTDDAVVGADGTGDADGTSGADGTGGADDAASDAAEAGDAAKQDSKQEEKSPVIGPVGADHRTFEGGPGANE